MGDVAMTAPVVARLREDYPDIKITVMTRPLFRPFFVGVEGVEFLCPDFKGRHKGLAGLWRLWREAGKFDLVADLHDVLRTKILRKLFLLCGARVAHIDKGRAGKRRLTKLGYKACGPLKTSVERYREVFLSLGLSVGPVGRPERVRLPLSDAAGALAGERSGGVKWLGVAPFAQHKGKIYPLEMMTEVIRELAGREGLKIFIFGGGSEEKEYAERIESDIPGVVSVIGKLPLSEELALISNLDAMLSMDSSSMHMASLFGVPTVSVWGATHPFCGFYGLGQDPALAIGLDMECRPCSVYGNKPCRKGDYPCMRGIAPEVIVRKVEETL